MPKPKIDIHPGSFFALFTVALLALLLCAGGAAAATPAFLGQTPDDGLPGSEAGRLDQGIGLATSPVNGHVYVIDSGNNRVNEFTAWGEFVKAFGWGVADGAAELQVCTSSCRGSISGAGAGQFTSSGEARGIAIDSSGSIYVADPENHRVQKFGPDGQFLFMLGGGVNKTTGADVCTQADIQAGDTCGAGRAEVADGAFAWLWRDGPLAVSPSDELYVGDLGQIQVFNAEGALTDTIDFSAVPGLPDDEVKALTIDAAGDLYVGFRQDAGSPDGVFKLDGATHQIERVLPIEVPTSLATDSQLNLYAVWVTDSLSEEIVEFDASGDCVICRGDQFVLLDNTFDATSDSIAIGEACGSTDIYVGQHRAVFGPPAARIAIYGPPPDTTLCPPPVRPPTIIAEYATSVGTVSAGLGAEINPHYWSDTTYYLEYGSGDCATSSCQKVPLSPRALSAKVTNASIATAPVQVEGLAPGSAYHYRFVAESSGGGPVFGPDRSFATRGQPEAPTSSDACPNAALRPGSAARLPDCRAYELVSPLEKGGSSILTLLSVIGFPAALDQSSQSGDKLTYSTVGAFAEPKSAPYVSQYLAERGPEGWANRSISPPRNAPIYGRGHTTDSEFKAFTPDLCESWLRHDSDPPLAPGVPEGFANFYRADQCGSGGYRGLRTPAPTNRSGDEYSIQLQGFSAGGSHTIFSADGKLSEDAPSLNEAGKRLLYESVGEEEARFVCILPNGQPVQEPCSAGSDGGTDGAGRTDSVHNAISADGSQIFWSPRGGRIYVRIDGTETRPVSVGGEAKSGSKGAFYLDATPGGSKVLFETGKTPATQALYTYDLESEETKLIAHRASGVLGSSEDLSRIYFVSREALDGGALAERPNLYLYEAGQTPTYTFVGELSEVDAFTDFRGSSFAPASHIPALRPSRVSPDGRVLAFMATGTPTGYDNLDRRSGKPDAEVYLYRIGEGLRCVSCDPTGARPRGRELELFGNRLGYWAAAKLPPWQNQLYASRALSEDGNRLYFESFQQLDPADTDEAQDVYQWEAPGSGSCAAGRGDYLASAGGCVSLISSAEGEAEFLDAGPDGADVFFTTNAGLVKQDYGLRDIYDARIEGGFPPPPAPRGGCQGAACQSPPPAPQLQAPASSTYVAPARKRCPKGRRAVHKKGKLRCLERKRHRPRKSDHHQQRRNNR